MAADPKVSVVMSVYNGQPFLAETIESIVNQTFQDFEFIIVDDGSTDGSPEILSKWAAEDSRILIVGQKNKGLTPSLNRGLNIARGEYIARIDSDDIALSDRLEKQVDYLDEHPNIGVLGTNAEHIDADGALQHVSDLPTDPIHIAWELLFTCPLYHPSVMMRRELVLHAGGYDSSIAGAEDYDLWTRIIRETDFANLKDIGIKYRWWGGNMTIEEQDRIHTNAASSAARLHTRYLKHAKHPGYDVARFYLGADHEHRTADELSSYFKHIIKLYHAFISERRIYEKILVPIRADVITRLEEFARLTRRRNKLKSLPLYLRLIWLAPEKVPDYLRSFFQAAIRAFYT